MSIKSDSPLVASLGALFAGAGLRVELAGRDERTRRRKVAFYGERERREEDKNAFKVAARMAAGTYAFFFSQMKCSLLR